MFLRRGSRKSRNQSPNILIDSTVSEIARPAGIVAIGNADILPAVGEHRAPAGDGGRHADPEEAQRCLGDDVARHGEARNDDDRAPDIRQDLLEQDAPGCRSPVARAARTNSSCLMDSTWPRTMRPYWTQPVSPSTRISLSRPLPSTAMMARASRIVGKDSWISAIRMMTSSTIRRNSRKAIRATGRRCRR